MAKKSVNAVLGGLGTFKIGDREFKARRNQTGEKFLFGPLPDLEAKTASGDEEAQAEYSRRIARILSARVVDGDPVTPEWVSEQDDHEVTNAILVIVGVREAEGNA